MLGILGFVLLVGYCVVFNKNIHWKLGKFELVIDSTERRQTTSSFSPLSFWQLAKNSLQKGRVRMVETWTGSYSKLVLFEKCPRAYYYKYIVVMTIQHLLWNLVKKSTRK
ncbi:hypothetical protein [Caldicellulosiruptor bescii]|uniref:hypothetical protein n=1 Tax=Caldicellulosiruptor bescii TaxID=31899 RepID=UPI001E3E5F4A|nr:hypothetical protein [Caldicellulosiruptor bescii]